MLKFFQSNRAGRWRSRWVPIVAVLMILLASLVIGIDLATRWVSRSLPNLERSLRTHQLATLRTYASRAESGSLLPPHYAVLAIRERFLQEVLDRSLPLRQTFEKGRYVVRLDNVQLRLEDGLAVVALKGRGMLASEEASSLYADLHLQGLFTISSVDPASGVLQASIVVANVQVRRAGPANLLDPVVRYFSHLQVEDWNRLGQRIQLPLKVDQEIVFPAVQGEVNLPESRIPLSVRVVAVTTLQQRLAVSLMLFSDSAAEFQASRTSSTNHGNGAVLSQRQREVQDTLGKDQRTNKKENLHERVEFLAQQDLLWQGVMASDHDVVALVPEPVLKRVTMKVFERYLKGVSVDLPEVTAKIDEKLSVKILGKKKNIGRIRGKVCITNLQGELTIADGMQLVLEPPNELGITLPVRVLAGRGTATFDMEWDPGLLTSLVCRRFKLHENLAGRVLPFRDEITARVRFSIRDSSLVGHPRIQQDRVSIKVDLSDESWDKVRGVLVEQDLLTRCGLVMNPDTVMVKLKKFAHQGIRIRLPDKIFKPFHLPVILETEYDTGDYRIRAKTYDPAIAVNLDYLRLAFQTELLVQPQK